MYNTINKIIGDNLRELREKRKMKAIEIANELDISESAYTKYERGESTISPTRAFQLADILNVTPYEILLPKEQMKIENSFHNSPINGTLTGSISNSTIIPMQIMESLFKIIEANTNSITEINKTLHEIVSYFNSKSKKNNE